MAMRLLRRQARLEILATINLFTLKRQQQESLHQRTGRSRRHLWLFHNHPSAGGRAETSGSVPHLAAAHEWLSSIGNVFVSIFDVQILVS